MKSEDKIISVSEAAEILHISSATILNWVRSGIIQRKENGINSVSVHSALKKILSGELNRLNNRANKRISAKSFSPKELSVDLLSVLKLNEFLSEFKKEDYSVKNFIDLKKIIYEYPELKNIETDFIYQSIKSIGNK
ncbi:MAG: helix-turn-helix domain-containing protein, partial [Candidatus Delongbacteria bacterium]|nr:helix-turn-helix domain-containing protein [Candidatus Delongbacteria bacterium]MCG2759878.1 helix-turn-helix domain-containing protein [Candidatus Delongbacteria bacterium]